MKKTSQVRRTAGVVVLLVLVLLLIFAFRKYSGRGENSSHPAGAALKALTVFYTCDTRGYIEPCGCASGMAGGISRRQKYLREHVPGHYLLVDAGDVGAGPREWEILELEYILKGYARMGYHAVNIGPREVSLSHTMLERLKVSYDRFISANLHDKDGQLVFEPYRIVTVGEGSRCGIIGVVHDHLEPDEIGVGLSVAPPGEALSRYLPDLKETSDFVILLAFVPEETLKALAQQYYELDLIVGGKVTQASGTPVRENQSTIVYITDKGKTIGRLDLSREPDDTWRSENDIIEMAEALPRDPEIVGLVEAYKQELKKRDFRPYKDDEEGLSSIVVKRSKNANTFVGQESCRECHPQAYEIWAKSGHAHAFHTLEVKDQQYNPRCLPCHTVGYMTSDGYINQALTPHLKDVSCESCHGRSDYHVKLEKKEPLPVKKVFMKKVDCLVCHDKENSPKFEYTTYWGKIEHGAD